MKTVLITGANRGMGAEFVRQYTARGDRVIACSRHETPDGVFLEVADPASIQVAAEKVLGLTDRLDILINNAGIPHCGDWKQSENFGTLNIEAMEKVIRNNTLGPLVFTQALTPLLKAGAPSVLAGITSYFSSLGGMPDYFANNFGYSMSKASLNMWLRSLSFILKEDGVRTVALDPGWVRTDMGGPKADNDPVEVVAGFIQVIDSLTPEQSGAYLDWKGATVPW